MSQVSVHPASDRVAGTAAKTAYIAWLVAATFYFYQYALRSAPSVMIPQLTEAFGLSALGVTSLAGLFYYGYSVFSLVAGAALDRLGPSRVMPTAAAVLGTGAIPFACGSSETASLGRVLQGLGGAFAAVGAMYFASNNFPASQAATLMGATQMFGMAGGSAGQFAVGRLIGRGLGWKQCWIGMGIVGLGMAVLLFIFLPKGKKSDRSNRWLKATLGPFYVVFKNPQSILCGLIAGLLFIPTTIFDMGWGVRSLQEAQGFDYASAVMRSAAVPFGWIIGCPLLGFISDRIGRRKPVIIGGAVVLMACLAWILFWRSRIFSPFMIGPVGALASG